VPLGIAIWQATDDSSPTSSGPSARAIGAAVAAASPASDPFPTLTETTIRVGGEELAVVVADTSPERSQGLRERETIGPYDGMLFVYPEPSLISFTMSTVPVPLDIGFYDAEGRLVTRLRMEPCPASQSECPSYLAAGEFVYALETLAGELPRGRLSG
jgi:uncharacterized membrane protein (UPF0127 family)